MKLYIMLAVKLFATCLLLLAGVTCGPVKEKRALVVLNAQKCRMPEGATGVVDGDKIVPVINDIRAKYEDLFDMVVLTREWHCENQIYFQSVNSGRELFSKLNLKYNKKGELCKSDEVTVPYAVPCTDYKYHFQQRVFPDHCVRDTAEAAFHPDLLTKPTDTLVNFGDNCHVPSYSAFFGKGRFKETELHAKLTAGGINTIVFTGLRLDYEIINSANDALRLGYKMVVILNATKPRRECAGTFAAGFMKMGGEITVVDSMEQYVLTL